MAEVIRMPLLSDTMTEGKIVAWNKKVGDKVKSDDVLADVETDKATMTEGKIVAWNKKVGDQVKSDDVLADVETDKATMEVVGYEEGTLLYIGVEAGKAAKINEIIAIVGKAGTDVSAYVAAEKSGA